MISRIEPVYEIYVCTYGTDKNTHTYPHISILDSGRRGAGRPVHKYYDLDY